MAINGSATVVGSLNQLHSAPDAVGLLFKWEQTGARTSPEVSTHESVIEWELYGWLYEDIKLADGQTEDIVYMRWAVYNEQGTVLGDGTAAVKKKDRGSNTKMGTGTIYVKHTHLGEYPVKFSFEAVVLTGQDALQLESETTAILDPAPIASDFTISKTHATLGESLTINIQRDGAEGVNHALTYRIEGGEDTVGYPIAIQYPNLSVEWAPPLWLVSQSPTSQQLALVLSLRTFYNGEQLGNTVEKTILAYIPDSYKPSVSISVDDTTDCFDKYGAYVQHESDLSVSLQITPAEGAEVNYRSTYVDGYHYSSDSFLTGPLKTSGELTIKSTVMDTRYRKGEATETINVLPYVRPTIKTLTVGRCDANGTANDLGEYIRVHFTASVTPLNDKNSATYFIRYKKSAERSYTAETFPSLDGIYEVEHEFLFQADTGSSYDVELVARDDLNTTRRPTSVSTAFALMHWHESGTGIAFGKVAEKGDLFDVGMPARFNSDVTGKVFGLGELESIISSTSLNNATYLIPGCYGVYNNTIAQRVLNIPVVCAGRLIVSAPTGQEQAGSGWAYRRQTFIPYDLKYGVFERDIVREGAEAEWTFHDWVCTAGGVQRSLWSVAASENNLLTGTITLSEKVSQQLNGIVLIFGEHDAHIGYLGLYPFFVPKGLVNYPVPHTFTIAATSFDIVCTKSVVIKDTELVGVAANGDSGTARSGITYNNGAFKLLAVWGV